jgi:peptidoglycan/xylan/chitin deacetylase (PgdA/CDA1 family)
MDGARRREFAVLCRKKSYSKGRLKFVNKKPLLIGLLVMAVALVMVWSYFLPDKLPGEAMPAKTAKSSDKLPARPVGVPVLMYHSIGEERDNDAVINKERFIEQMAYLKSNGFTTISLDELFGYLHEGRGLPPKPVVLTFDDGYRDTYEVAFPILKQYGFKAVVFIPASFAGVKLSWQEIREMKAAGVEIASHSFSHNELGAMPLAEQTKEIVESKAVFDKYLNQDTRSFCYPNSSYNQETLKILREKGFILGFTTEPGWAKPGDDLLTLKRIWMGNSVTVERLEERLSREDYPII